jgi:putative membrane protein
VSRRIRRLSLRGDVMAGFLAAAYPWIKALHVIAVIAWMAGLLYLPRLFVYHTAAAPGSAQAETFKVMERRLLRAIMNPSLIATYVLGALLLWQLSPGIWSEGWIWVKLAAVAGLTVLHHLFGRWRKAFALELNTRDARFYRAANEAPTILMIIIVIMAVVKPF